MILGSPINPGFLRQTKSLYVLPYSNLIPTRVYNTTVDLIRHLLVKNTLKCNFNIKPDTSCIKLTHCITLRIEYIGNAR